MLRKAHPLGLSNQVMNMDNEVLKGRNIALMIAGMITKLIF